MQAGRRCSPSALAGSSVGGPGREGRCASVAGRPSRARRGGEHTDARRASCIGQMRAPAACVGARASVPSNARPVTRPGLVNGCAVVGFAGRALGSQRGEHCCFARPVRLPVACEICGVMTAHEDSDSACGHGQLLGLLGGCCDRCLAQGGPDARTRAHSACGLGGANARERLRRRVPAGGSFPVAGGYRPPRPEITGPAVAAVRERTCPEADAATGWPSAPAGPWSAHRGSEPGCATRSRVLSRDGGVFAFVRRESPAEQAADQRRGCERQMPAPARAPRCRATLLRASRRTCACGGTSRLTPVELVTAAATASRERVAEI